MSASGPASPALTALLERVVDYAGLFPPARLPMADAVRAYADYRHGSHAWMLGRFVVPVSRLEEFEEEGGAAGALPDAAHDSWALSVLVGADVELDTSSVAHFNDRHRDVRRGAVHVDTLELRAASPAEIGAADDFVAGYDAYFEVPIAEDPAPLIAAIAAIGAKAKIRTGGVTPEAIPGARHVLRFIRRCLEYDVAFKATAGLHHAVRAEHPLTYEPDAPRGVMHGFLNVLLAGALLRDGADEATVLDLLEEHDGGAMRLDGDRVVWHGHALTADALRLARHETVAFGSCSFVEPVDELRTMGWL